jgi:hypothetical protein
MNGPERQLQEASDDYMAGILARANQKELPPVSPEYTRRQAEEIVRYHMRQRQVDILSTAPSQTYRNPVEEEWHPQHIDVGDSALPMTLWLQKYSKMEYLARHRILSTFSLSGASILLPDHREKVVDSLRRRLHDGLWGIRSILSVHESWSARNEGSLQDPWQWFDSFEMIQSKMPTGLDDQRYIEVVLEVSAISMPMRPVPLGCIR